MNSSVNCFLLASNYVGSMSCGFGIMGFCCSIYDKSEYFKASTSYYFFIKYGLVESQRAITHIYKSFSQVFTYICYLLVNHFLSPDMLAWNSADILSRLAVRLLYQGISTHYTPIKVYVEICHSYIYFKVIYLFCTSFHNLKIHFVNVGYVH